MIIQIFFVWLKFFICSALLVIGGYKLCKCCDIIADKTRLSHALLGVFFLALATSFPEVVTSIGSIVSVKSPDLAVGDVFGTIVINLMIIAILDYVQGKGPIMYHAKINHILYGGLTIVSLGVVALSFVVRSILGSGLTFFNVGVESFVVILIYAIGLFLIFSYEKKEIANETLQPNNSIKYQGVTLRGTIFKFLFYFGLVAIAGIWLANIGNEIVVAMNWNQTLVGTIFLAIATSFPELVVSISALGMGAIDLAIGNILGSNFFDVMIIPICDIFFTKGSLLSFISLSHLITILLAIIMTSIVIIGLIYRSQRSILKIGWDIVAMVAVFIIGYIILCFAT